MKNCLHGLKIAQKSNDFLTGAYVQSTDPPVRLMAYAPKFVHIRHPIFIVFANVCGEHTWHALAPGTGN